MIFDASNCFRIFSASGLSGIIAHFQFDVRRLEDHVHFLIGILLQQLRAGSAWPWHGHSYRAASACIRSPFSFYWKGFVIISAIFFTQHINTGVLMMRMVPFTRLSVWPYWAITEQETDERNRITKIDLCNIRFSFDVAVQNIPSATGKQLWVNLSRI